MHVILYVYSTFCMKYIAVPNDEPRHPCNPSPCGANAICRERNGAGSCTCVDDFHGDPYLGCRPECVMNNDCATDRSCFNNKCVDPCPGTCGQNAECRVANYAPSCYCLPGYTGNPLHACTPVLCKLIILHFLIYFDSYFISYCICIFTWFCLYFSYSGTCRPLPPFTLWTL